MDHAPILTISSQKIYLVFQICVLNRCMTCTQWPRIVPRPTTQCLLPKIVPRPVTRCRQTPRKDRGALNIFFPLALRFWNGLPTGFDCRVCNFSFDFGLLSLVEYFIILYFAYPITFKHFKQSAMLLVLISISAKRSFLFD